MRYKINGFLRLGISGVAALWLLGGCALFHHHARKPHSYDRSISDEDRDPTYQEDPERADVEVHDEQ